jgi:tRNA threonylcarbamoyladenosine biosynthesis protein TsaB
MRILAWETTGMAGSVSALTDGRILVERDLPAVQRSAQSLAPAVHALLAEVGWRPADVELIATAIGPGSFTGLRVGITMAKMMSYAIGCPLVGVNALEAIASRAPRNFTALSVAMDAQRRQVFAARFTRSADGNVSNNQATEILDVEAWLASLGSQWTATGPILKRLADRLPAGAQSVPPEFWSPTAGSIGELGWRLFSAGQRDDPFQLVPLYLRRTAAEEQWDRRSAAT